MPAAARQRGNARLLKSGEEPSRDLVLFAADTPNSWKPAGLLEELFHCNSQVGNQKINKPIFETAISADFIAPLIEPSVPVVRFEYMSDETDEIQWQTQTLSLKNTSSLPLTLLLKASVPFAVDTAEMGPLPPGESGKVTISFNPAYPGDKECMKHESKLQLAYREHPQKDGIKLLGETFFPNLTFDLEKGDFGAVFNDTPRSLPLTISNPSRVAA